MDNDALRFLTYLSFKMDCLRIQEENPLTIDREKAQHYFDLLSGIVEEKKAALVDVMPKRAVMSYKNKPQKPYKKDGTLSSIGEKWFAFLKEQKLPEDTEGPVGYIEGYEEGNPGSSEQIKDWLFSLGWEPCTYKFNRNKATGEEKQIPQVRYFSNNDPRKGELTESVKSLCSKVPELEVLEGLTVAQHRASIFKAFLEASDEATGACVASAGGFTNTMRFKHRNPFVNLPKADGSVPWGVEIRSCIIAPEGYEICGSDVVSLEATTKRHYMYPHDPEYADAMGAEGFDEHLDLALHAGAVGEEDLEFYQENKDSHSDNVIGKIKEIKSVRKQYKATNYSAIYGVGPPKLARELFIKEAKAKALLKAYWDRNWSIKKVSEEQYVKTLKDGSMWLKNPVSGFYYSLRYLKDVFSTLNQSTGVYIFDQWLLRVLKSKLNVPFQYHDELAVYRLLNGIISREEVKSRLDKAMEGVNNALKLNVDVRVDVQFGNDYSEVH